jgi:hypothetical protein
VCLIVGGEHPIGIDATQDVLEEERQQHVLGADDASLAATEQSPCRRRRTNRNHSRCQEFPLGEASVVIGDRATRTRRGVGGTSGPSCRSLCSCDGFSLCTLVLVLVSVHFLLGNIPHLHSITRMSRYEASEDRVEEIRHPYQLARLVDHFHIEQCLELKVAWNGACGTLLPWISSQS